MKRLGSFLYTDSKIVYRRQERVYERVTDPNGYLFAGGTYPTKIKQDDLPPWYISGYFRRCQGWINTKGVVDLVYRPSKFSNHMTKDDFLFISYKYKIVPADSILDYSGFDYYVWGGNIITFLQGVEKNSEYDIEPIRARIREKAEWLKETFPDDYKLEVGDWIMNFLNGKGDSQDE